MHEGLEVKISMEKSVHLRGDTSMLLFTEPKALETVQDTVRLTFGTIVILYVTLPST